MAFHNMGQNEPCYHMKVSVENTISYQKIKRKVVCLEDDCILRFNIGNTHRM